ncbi:MAG: thioredoxin family protein [Candidatus Cloacimonadota bacterium]
MRYRLLLVVLMLIALVACRANSDKSGIEQERVDAPQPVTDSLATQSYKITFLELGAESCVPCRMMKPIMRDIAAEYPGVVEVIFHDLYRDREIGQRWNVRVMPTQIFLDSEGREFFRHEGFYPKEELKEMLDNFLAQVNQP